VEWILEDKKIESVLALAMEFYSRSDLVDECWDTQNDCKRQAKPQGFARYIIIAWSRCLSYREMICKFKYALESER
jgi:hypothetical protein